MLLAPLFSSAISSSLCAVMVLEDDPCAAPAAAMKASKKNKHKKIPQRGLGVAQLEKLRLEEQKRNADSSPADPRPQLHIPLPTTTNNDAFLRIPRANSNFVLGSASASAQRLEGADPNNDQHAFYHPTLWNGLDPSACSNEPLPKRFGFHVPLGTMQKQQPPITMVSTATLPLPSGVDLRIEPPSNQTNSNSYNLLTCWREQERNLVKMAGSKRPWPFHLDGASGQESYPRKLPPFPSSCVKPEECSGQSFRGGTSTSNSFVDLKRSDFDLGKRSKENAGAKDGKFPSLCSHSTLKSDDNHPFYQHEHSDLSLYNLERSSPNGQPFFHFLPICPSSSETTPNEIRVGASDDIDLNLKL